MAVAWSTLVTVLSVLVSTSVLAEGLSVSDSGAADGASAGVRSGGMSQLAIAGGTVQRAGSPQASFALEQHGAGNIQAIQMIDARGALAGDMPSSQQLAAKQLELEQDGLNNLQTGQYFAGSKKTPLQQVVTVNHLVVSGKAARSRHSLQQADTR